jgi:Flp pilus assembly protein TadD
MSDDYGGVDPVPSTPAVNDKITETPASQRGTGWPQLWQWAKQAIGVIAVGAWILWVILLVAEKTIQKHRLIIDPIAVPKSLAEEGFSTEVVTQHLRDAIKELQNRAPTPIEKNRVDVSESIPDVTIPKIGVTVGDVASSLHQFLPKDWQHEISGEFFESGSEIYVRMRLNGELVFSETGVITAPDEVDILINKAALKILETTEPYVAATFLVATGDFTDATRLVDQIIASSPPDDESVKWAYVLKGLIAQRNDRLDEAISEYRRAIALDPESAAAHDNLGNALLQHGELDEAISEYRRAIELDPKSATAHNNLGNALRQQGKLDEAVSEYRLAIQLDPKFAPAHSALGNVLRQQGKLDEAISEHRLAIQLDPKFAGWHNNLGNALFQQGNRDEAISEFRRAIELDPQFAGPHHNLGNVFFVEGKLDEAISEYRRAIVLDPKDAGAHNNLGNALLQQGNRDEAISEYRSAIVLDPNLHSARHNLSNLQQTSPYQH